MTRIQAGIREGHTKYTHPSKWAPTGSAPISTRSSFTASSAARVWESVPEVLEPGRRRRPSEGRCRGAWVDSGLTGLSWHAYTGRRLAVGQRSPPCPSTYVPSTGPIPCGSGYFATRDGSGKGVYSSGNLGSGNERPIIVIEAGNDGIHIRPEVDECPSAVVRSALCTKRASRGKVVCPTRYPTHYGGQGL